MDIVLKTRMLTKQYADCTALDRVSLDLERGRIYGLVGKNGAGKSTLFQILAGMVRPTSGSYSILGAQTARENRLNRRRTSFLFPNGGMCEGLSALQNLIALQKLRGYTDPGEARVLLKTLGLEGAKAERERLRTFSTGQRQKAALASALMGSPELLILDEPLLGLDAEAMATVRDLLRDVVRSQGRTVLLSSHNLPLLYELSTDYIFMHQGACVETVDHETLRRRCDYVISLAAEPLEQAQETLAHALPGAELGREGDRLILRNSTATAPQLETMLRQHGVTVRELTVRGSSLEDYFLSVTGEDR